MQSTLLPKFDFGRAWKHVPWKKILIGDLMRINVTRLVYQQAYDIILCGVLGALSLLITVCALALPAEMRAVVWIGAAFALVAAVDRPSWKPLLRLPLIVMIMTVGIVALSARLTGYPAEWVIWAALRYGILNGLGMALGFLIAFQVAEFTIRVFYWGFMGNDYSASEKAEAKAVRNLVKSSFGFKMLWWSTRKDGTMVFLVNSRVGRQVVGAELARVLARPVEFRPKKHWYQDNKILVFPPKQEMASDAQSPALS